MSNSWIINQTVDLSQGIDSIKVWPKALLVTGDENAHTWRVEIKDKGQPASVSGGVMGYFVRSDGDTVIANGTLEGNVAKVTLPKECYAYEGDLQALMRLSSGSENVSLSALLFRVRSIVTDAVVDPGEVVPSLDELFAQLAAIHQATKDANTATNNANSAAERAENATEDISGMKEDAEKAVSDAKQAVQDAQTAVDLSESILDEARTATSAANDAASSANAAAGSVNEAKTNAENAAKNANNAADRVDNSIDAAVAAAERAEASADAADTATGKANSAAQEAQSATQFATEAAETANTSASNADSATERANTAASGVEEATQRANDAADRAETSIHDATEATEAANAAASKANTAAEGANTAAGEAASASTSATQAAGDANIAADRANEAADRANQAASGAGLQKKVVDTLPALEAMADDTIYIVPSENPDSTNNYDEYIKVNGKAEPFGPSIDATPTEGSTNPVQSGGVYDATKWHSNPNLLINWYFVNEGLRYYWHKLPINQRGKSIYNGPTGYTIDMWCKREANENVATLNVTDTGLVYSTPTEGVDSIHSIDQRIEININKSTTFTASILVSDLSFSRVMPTLGIGNIYSDDVSKEHNKVVKIDRNGLHSVTFELDSGYPYIQINAVANIKLNIIAAKFEIGDHQTLAHQDADGNWVLNDPTPNYQQELAKCQRYQILGNMTAMNHIGNNYMFLPTPVTMRGNPTIVGKPALYIKSNNTVFTGDYNIIIGGYCINGIVLYAQAALTEEAYLYFSGPVGLDANLG